MKTVKASLLLFKNGRKSPFKNGYRPLFNINGKKYSGSIHLENQLALYPGEKAMVTISFLLDTIEIGKGDVITFDEGIKELGEITII